jgi:ADP-heptose:LPS heptosyltransferase
MKELAKEDPFIDHIVYPDFYYPPSKNLRKKIVNLWFFLRKKIQYDKTFFEEHQSENFIFNYKEKHRIDLFSDMFGVKPKKRRPVIYLNEDDKHQADSVIKKINLEKNELLIVVGPEIAGDPERWGERHKRRAWPAKNFDNLAKKILKNYRAKIISLHAPDQKNTFKYMTQYKGLPIRASAHLISKADLFIGMDSGLTIIGSCFDTKIVSIHCGISKTFTGILSPNAKIIYKGADVSPLKISIEEVYQAAKEQIESI